MARPYKTGIDYFPLDVDFFVDDKMIAIAGGLVHLVEARDSS